MCPKFSASYHCSFDFNDRARITERMDLYRSESGTGPSHLHRAAMHSSRCRLHRLWVAAVGRCRWLGLIFRPGSNVARFEVIAVTVANPSDKITPVTENDSHGLIKKAG
ncbi:hypothetical protein CEXT_632961 [Caerostris extrusa]|uniref:Uncharacterized protein n=1 Tax=Caerostris extrusa TaxID=172846 RepID=A0AAV4MYJ0_CAEEX|nr:hypothetical protein CEXT_632961 [Caerostris extrusa]